MKPLTLQTRGVILTALGRRLDACEDAIAANTKRPGPAPAEQVYRTSYWISEYLLAHRAQAEAREVFWS